MRHWPLGIYDEEEAKDQAANGAIIPTGQSIEVQVAPPPAQTETVRAEPTAEPKSRSLQDELASLVIDAGFTFDEFKAWAVESGNVDNIDSLASFDDIPKDTAKRLLRARVGLLDGIKRVTTANV